ncbi:MAG TPA: hypothetical protein VGM90_41505 [Kofleriaceae bacterium]|jgi:hypothetical protein
MRALHPLIAVLAVGCSTSNDGPVADPVGTVTTELRTGTSIRFLTGSTSGGPIDLTIDSSLNFQGSVVPYGPVSGVGEITTVPSSGFVQTASAATGTGFVVKTNDGLKLFYAVYVDADIVSTGGGVIGKTIKWHALTTLASIAVTPAAATIVRPAMGVGQCSFAEPVHYVATGMNSDGTTNDMTLLAAWTSTPAPAGGNIGPFLSAMGVATVTGSSDQANGCPATPLGAYTINAAYDAANVTGTTTLTIQ